MKLKPALLSALLTTVLFIALLTACAERVVPTPKPIPTPEPGEPAPSAPALPKLAPGAWTAFSPGGETVCADGSPYTFYVRPGTVNRVVIDFEGGGACWNGATCGEGGPYQPRIPDPEGRVVGLSGLYDKTRSDNPVADWYHVFVSYCTADVHLGDSVETYDTARGERTVRHNGQENVAAVLDWVFASFAAPESVLVTGCSAGAYGAALYTPHIADAYPDADITQLGDCGAGVIPESFVTGEDGLGRWNIGAVLPAGVDLMDGVPTTFLADAYVEIGEVHPEVTLAQYNSLLDGVQIGFYARQLGLEPSDPAVQERVAEAWVGGLVTSLERIRAGLPEGFSSYTSLLDDDGTLQNGTLHCLINRPEFYTLAVNGVSFVAWLDALLNGDAPPPPVAPPTQELPSALPRDSQANSFAAGRPSARAVPLGR